MTQRLIIALTGASGVVYGIRALEMLRADPGVEVHLVLSSSARTTIAAETDWTPGEVLGLADVTYHPSEIGAAIASGSFATIGMLVAPCSVKTLSGIANCYSDSLITRAADVVLKERRTLVLLVRETPLHRGHLRLMAHAAEAGAVIMPPVPSFYHRPTTLVEMVDQSVGRALDQFGLTSYTASRWTGLKRHMNEVKRDRISL